MRNVLFIVAAVVLLLGITVLLQWLSSRRRVRVGRSGGVAVLRLATGRNAILGVLALLPGLMLAALPFAMRERAAAQVALAALAALLAFAFAAYFFASEFRARVRVGDGDIERVGVLGRRRLAWGDVQKITYNPTTKSFFLLGKDGTRLWIYESFEGIGDFAELALRNLPPALLAGEAYVREELEELAAI
jgi:hypothetical protein